MTPLDGNLRPSPIYFRKNPQLPTLRAPTRDSHVPPPSRPTQRAHGPRDLFLNPKINSGNQGLGPTGSFAVNYAQVDVGSLHNCSLTWHMLLLGKKKRTGREDFATKSTTITTTAHRDDLKKVKVALQPPLLPQPIRHCCLMCRCKSLKALHIWPREREKS